MMDFHDAFTLDHSSGRLYWLRPAKNHAEKIGREAGYIAKGNGKNKSYWHIRLDGRTYKRSRVVFHMVHGRWPSPCVDHINGDSLDDRPNNLREATHRQNAQNMQPRRNKRSGLPQGVSPYQGKYRAQIHVDGKRRVIGQYACPEEAAAAYQSARQEAFHDFA